MDAIVATAVLLLPGFIASAMLDFLLLRRPKAQFDKTAESLALTFTVYGLTTLFPRLFSVSVYVGRILDSEGQISLALLFTASFLRDLLFLSALATAVAAGVGALLRLPCVRKRWVRIFGRNYYSRVWDSAFDKNINEYVVQADMKDGQVWLGTVLEASDNSGEREILLRNPALSVDGAILPAVAGSMLIDGSSVQRLFFIPREAYEADGTITNQEGQPGADGR